MKTRFSATVAGALLMVFGAPPVAISQDRIPELQRETRTYDNSTTLTGCVVRGAVTGTYVLTNMTKDGETAGRDAVERISVVLSSNDVDVSAHLGHRVSVTGLYADAVSVMGITATAAKPAPGAAIPEIDKKPIQTFRVKSLAMVGESCSESANQP